MHTNFLTKPTGVYWIGILMDYFLSMDFNGLHVILILCGFLIKCRRVDIDLLGFKHNASKSYRFRWNFKKFKNTMSNLQNPSFYQIQKIHQHLNTIRF